MDRATRNRAEAAKLSLGWPFALPAAPCALAMSVGPLTGQAMIPGDFYDRAADRWSRNIPIERFTYE